MNAHPAHPVSSVSLVTDSHLTTLGPSILRCLHNENVRQGNWRPGLRVYAHPENLRSSLSTYLTEQPRRLRVPALAMLKEIPDNLLDAIRQVALFRPLPPELPRSRFYTDTYNRKHYHG